MAVHEGEVVSRVSARDRFRAVPTDYARDTRLGIQCENSLVAWVDTYEWAHENGMALLALHSTVDSFRVEKEVVRINEKVAV